VTSEAADAASVSIIECLERIAEQVRLSPQQELSPSTDHVMQELRGCITTYASALRDLNTPPESAIVVVKRMISERLGPAVHIRAAINGAVVPWVIEAYFPPAASV
jgi:hypothetical protein